MPPSSSQTVFELSSGFIFQLKTSSRDFLGCQNRLHSITHRRHNGSDKFFLTAPKCRHGRYPKTGSALAHDIRQPEPHSQFLSTRACSISSAISSRRSPTARVTSILSGRHHGRSRRSYFLTRFTDNILLNRNFPVCSICACGVLFGLTTTPGFRQLRPIRGDHGTTPSPFLIRPALWFFWRLEA
jgi:hypothetical protein